MTQEQQWYKEAERAFEDCGYLVPIKTVAKTFGLSRGTVYRMVEQGDLEGARGGVTTERTGRGSVRIVRSSAVSLLASWLAAGAAGADI